MLGQAAFVARGRACAASVARAARPIVSASAADAQRRSRCWSWAIAYLGLRSQIDPAADADREPGAASSAGSACRCWLGWVFGGLARRRPSPGWSGKISLGLRTDYLAIATIGIAEIIRAVLKNVDWLTARHADCLAAPAGRCRCRTTPGSRTSASSASRRARYSCAVVAVVIVVIFSCSQRAYHGPWGRDDARHPRQPRRRRGDGQGRQRAASSRSSCSARRHRHRRRDAGHLHAAFSIRAATSRSTTPS